MSNEFKQDVLDDGGWASRKLWLAFFAIVTLGVTYWFSRDFAVLQGLYPTFGGFVIGLVTLYYGANTGHSYIAAKTPDAPPPPPGV